MNVTGTKKKNQVAAANIFEQQELLKKAERIRNSLIASTWRELETNTTYIVRVHFSKTSKETMSDKIKRMLKNEIQQM